MNAAAAPAPESARTAVTLARCAIDLLAHYPRQMTGLLIHGRTGSVRDRIKAALESQLTLNRLPADLSAEVLEGGIDRHRTLLAGQLVHHQGLLSRYRDHALMLNVSRNLSAAVSRTLSQALDKYRPEKLPRLVIFDESEADEPGAADSALADRLPIHLFAPMIAQRELDDLWAMSRYPGGLQELSTPDARERPAALPPEQVHRVHINEQQVQDIASVCLQLGVGSCRAASHCLHLARLLASLHGREIVITSDLATAMQLSLAPRATRLPDSPKSGEAAETASNTNANNANEADDPTEQSITEPDGNHRANSQDDNTHDEHTGQSTPTSIVDSVLASLPPGLLREHSMRKAVTRRSVEAGSGRSGLKRPGGQHGPIIGTTRQQGAQPAKINLPETIKAAIPLQKFRRKPVAPMHAVKSPQSLLIIRPSDIRVSRHQRAIRTTTVFAVDASGSTAMQRLAEAKGAVEILLADCYVRRDQVALITFRGTTATLDLSPTRSLTRARRALKDLPGGGGTPMASGIALAVDTVKQLQHAGEQAVVVFMSDARANVTLDGQASRLQATIDAEQQASRLARLGVRVLFIDSSSRPSARAQRLAAQLQADYLALPHTDLRTLPARVGLQP